MSHAMSPSQKIARPSRRLLILSALVCLALLVGLWRNWAASAMDLARAETRVDLAASTFNVSGQGVVVALLDRGIDWRNNDFRKDDGTTRIKYIFDLTDNTGAGAPGNVYGRGTIYTEAQINAALAGGTPLATRDAVGHGTTTAGIPTGNGRNSTNRKYRGIAPNATIIAVKVTSEGAPAHDGEPAEVPFNDSTAYPVAIDFVRDKKLELGMPAVMLLNLGSILGPTDGTSSLARKIDATVGPGLVFVSGPGDDGGRPNHAGGVVTQGGTSSIQIQKGSASTLIFDLWYGGNDRFDVSLQTPNGNFGPFTSPPTNNDQGFVTNSTLNYFHKGANLVFFGATNGKREIFIQLTGPVGTYTVQLQGATVSNGRFDATINPSNINQPPAQSNRFLNFVVPGSIWDGATAHNNICPNSYVIRNNYTDIDGVPRSITGQGNPGELWLGSSVGPTFDNRLGVDVSAPGDSVFTTYNPKSYFATFRHNLIQDGGGFYGRASAVSAAAPQVTGIIALMLEKNPQLDAAQVKSILQRSARTDSFTGATPNPNWGYGKVDAFEAVSLAQWQPVALTAQQIAEIKAWTVGGRTYVYVKPQFPDAGYRVVNWGQAVRSANDFTADASVERFVGPSIHSVVTTAQIYDLGPLADGMYNFNFKTSGTLAQALQFTVSSAIPPPNPIDNAREFVRQQYRDFLNREADQAGEDFWTDNITKCADPARRPAGQTEAQCTLRQRETTSGAFFLSPEFQYTGYYVYRMYVGALGRQPKLSEFIPDAQFVGNGIVVNGQLSGAKINQNKADYAQQFVNCTDAAKYRCAEFKAIYDTLNNQQYVDKLFLTTGVNASASDRDALVNGLTGGTETRASVLQKVVDGIVVISEGNQQFTTSYGQAFYNSEFNRAFVQLEYFGYMKRDPDEAGYAFWLGKLNQFGGDFVNAEMVLAFISSPEYRARFGQP